MANYLVEFMRDLPVHRLAEKQREILEGDATVDELGTVMTHLQSDKAPGPNGYPIEFFRAS